MSDTSEMYEKFWDGFDKSYSWPSNLIGSPNKFVHRTGGKPKPYYEFDNRLSLGFRPRAIIIKDEDQLRAELLTTNKTGIAFVSDNQTNPISNIGTYGQHINWHVAPKYNDAKIELVWNNAMVSETNLWPAHHLWLRLALEELTQLFTPIIDKYAEQVG